MYVCHVPNTGYKYPELQHCSDLLSKSGTEGFTNLLNILQTLPLLMPLLLHPSLLVGWVWEVFYSVPCAKFYSDACIMEQIKNCGCHDISK